MAEAVSQRAAMDGAIRHLVQNYSPAGNRIGWLMMASIIVEAWDFNVFGLVFIFIRDQYHPDPFMLSLAAAGAQGGAFAGAILGGWLTDKLGRRVMFLSTMVLFIVMGLAQAFVTSIGMLIVVRFILGVPLGSDVTTGYTYIMECMPKGRREVMGGRWQFMFAAGQTMALIILVPLLAIDLPHEWVWRIMLGLGAVPAVVILYLRRDLPETAMWLIHQGRFHDAKVVTRKMYGDDLAMLVDENVRLPKPRPTAFLADLWRDPVRKRATLYGWIACFCQGGEFSTFGFYIPVLFAMVGVSSLVGTNLILIPVYVFGGIGAWIMPQITPRIGHRGIGMAGFGAVLGALLVAAVALYTHQFYILPFAAAVMLWGQYCATSNCMTIPTMVAKPEYRGTASGFSYMIAKIPQAPGIFLFPALFAAIGQANATLFVTIFPLVGLASAIFLLPEVYGYEKS
jgi:MFS family permease